MPFTIPELFFEKDIRDNIQLQTFRALIVAGIAFGVDFCSLWMFVEFLKFHYLFGVSFSFILGLVTNYALSTTWVFYYHSEKSKLKEFVIFAAVGVGGLIFTYILMWILTDLFVVHYLFSKIITTIIVFFWNFLLRKYLLYRRNLSVE